MVGIIIGLIVGVAAVVAVVMYFSHAGTPFSNLQKMQRPASAPSASTPAQTQILTPGIAITNASSPAPAQPVPAQTVTPAVTPAATPAHPAAPASAPTAKLAKTRPGSPNDKDSQRFDFYKILPGQVDAVASNNGATPANAGEAKKQYLQLGSFQSQDDADNLKAKLALMGIEATIQSIDIPDKGMVHRVRVGPFTHQDDIDRIKTQIKQDGINIAVKLTN